jgi:hypothetical protein
MSDLFRLLPDELVQYIALFSSNYVVNPCLTSRFKKIILDEEYFWKQRCILHPKIENCEGSWKALYKSSISTKIFVF